MPNLESKLSDALGAYGALPSQLVDLTRNDEPRLLSYLDLCSKSPGWRLPVVVENAGRPCVHVFDGREPTSDEEVGRWCWRIALRGDGAWVGLLEPGRLRIYRTEVAGKKVQPIELESAQAGDLALPRFLNDVRAGNDDLTRRSYLKSLLDQSAQDATDCGLSQTDALSLVGRGLFWRFLVDRKLLAGVNPRDICDTAEAWEQCLDSKSRALRTFSWLNETFNGGLLPFEGKPREFDTEVFSRVLGNIAHGATETGQLRLPSDWKQVNFSYLPVGLLSEVHEAFARTIDAEEANRKSIHYTPSHLVEFIVAQALEQLPEGGRPRLLDPAAGAGVFLVIALRKLIEREWLEKGERPKRTRIREILNRQLVGFDTDMRALRLTELALYLTALELDPNPQPVKALKFDELRGNVLFELTDAEHGSLGPVEERFRGQFDLVIGNPPWTAKAKGRAEKKAWVAYTRNIVRERLGEARAKAFDLPDTNPDLPFVWRAMEWAKPRGRIALVTHARWLFGISGRAARARSDLLEAMRVTGILNGSALRLTKVWPEVDAPWCVLFATNEPPQPFNRAAFQFVSPALDAEVDSKQARMRIDWLDAQTVLASEVVERPWTLKARFRGNRLTFRTLESMIGVGVPLSDYLGQFGTEFKNGYILYEEGKQYDASRMIKERLYDTKDAGPLGFFIDSTSLPLFCRKTLHRRRSLARYKAPLLLIRKAVPADPLKARTHLAAVGVAFHESFHGASFEMVSDGLDLARYLQLVLQSSAFLFFEILTDPQYGMFVDAIYLESVLRLPVVPFSSLSQAQKDRARKLSIKLASGLTPSLAAQIDNLVFDTFKLSRVEREAIRDTVETALPSTSAKRRAVSPPTPQDREQFTATLTDSLSSVLSASNLRTAVREHEGLTLKPWRIIEVAVSREGISSNIELPLTAFLEEADANGASLVVVRASETTWFVGLLERYSLWTPTRARLLATDLIAERSPR